MYSNFWKYLSQIIDLFILKEKKLIFESIGYFVFELIFARGWRASYVKTGFAAQTGESDRRLFFYFIKTYQMIC